MSKEKEQDPFEIAVEEIARNPKSAYFFEWLFDVRESSILALGEANTPESHFIRIGEVNAVKKILAQLVQSLPENCEISLSLKSRCVGSQIIRTDVKTRGKTGMNRILSFWRGGNP